MFRLIISIILLLPCSLLALSYQQPDTRLAQLVANSSQLHWQLSANNNWLIQTENADRPDLAELRYATAELAGLRINLEQLSVGLGNGYKKISLQHNITAQHLEINALAKQRLYAPKLSPDENWLSVVVAEPQGLFIKLVNLKNGKQRQNKQRLNAIFGIQYQWLADSSAIVMLAEHQADTKLIATALPSVYESNTDKEPQRTYQMLLSSPNDNIQFSQLIQSRLVQVSTNLRSKTLLQLPLYRFALSPDNQYVLVDQILQPYSYLVQADNFSRSQDIYSISGNKIVNLQQQGVHESRKTRPGLKHIAWRADQPATLYWVAAHTNKAFKEALWQWPAPFKAEHEKLHDLAWRFSKVQWSSNRLAVLYEADSSTKQERAWFFPDGLAEPGRIWYQRHTKDQSGLPGRLLTTTNQYHRQVLKQTARGEMYLLSDDNELQPQELNIVSLTTDSKTLLWRAASDAQDSFIDLIDDGNIFYSQQKLQQPAELYQQLASNVVKRVSVAHPAPSYQHVTRQQVNYQRADGVKLNGWLYLPAGYNSAMGPLPVLMWAYPREYDSVAIAEQQTANSHRFMELSASGAQAYVALGYAVFAQVSMPIIADEDTAPNDTFLPQLIANAEAAINTLVKMGVAERGNIAIGGHSYGAFMVANLLAHTDLFAAGIARSGAYNRSLTPFGFQSEKRNFWQQPQIYTDMSPFFHADKINAPLLMIHGQADANSGTHPEQSLRMFNALKGLGKVSRLVMLPLEGHHYQARESALRLLWEQQQWLAQYLKATPAMQKNSTE